MRRDVLPTARVRSLIRGLAGNAGRRIRNWARRRQGPDPSQFRLESRRVYIFPTAAGCIFAVMVTTMLAGAMNYNNNLGFGLAFTLGGLGIAAIYETHRTLNGLRLHYLGADPVFVGAPLRVCISMVNDAPLPREEIYLSWAGDTESTGGRIDSGKSRLVSLALPTYRRGFAVIPPIRVSTQAPLGLVRAWAWVNLDARPLVWPRPSAINPASFGAGEASTSSGQRNSGDDDLAGLRAYRPGDSPRHVAWKSFARTSELLVRDYRGGNPHAPLWLDWDALPEKADIEERISMLTRMALDEQHAGRVWGLRLPGTEIAPAGGDDQLQRCLRVLSTAMTEAAPA